MTTLMIYNGPAEPTAEGPRTGGIPLTPHDFTWPTCTDCGSPQRFLAQIDHPAGTTAAFQCEDSDGACETWEAFSGSNHAALFPPGTPLTPATVPTRPPTFFVRVCQHV